MMSALKQPSEGKARISVCRNNNYVQELTGELSLPPNVGITDVTAGIGGSFLSVHPAGEDLLPFFPSQMPS